MNIIINDHPKELPENATLITLLRAMGYEEFTGIALAVNQQIIPKTSWEHYELKEQDNITLFSATCGG